MNCINYDTNTTIIIDGDSSYKFLKDKAKLISGGIDYNDNDHPMYWTNIQISNI